MKEEIELWKLNLKISGKEEGEREAKLGHI